MHSRRNAGLTLLLLVILLAISVPTNIPAYAQTNGITTRVSVASDGTQANSSSARPAISTEGRYVAFESSASNLVSGDTNGQSDVFAHDRQTGSIIRVSIASNGTQGDGPSFSPAISADGRYVAFISLASNLVNGDTNASDSNTNGGYDTFVHDRQTGATTRVSVASDGTQSNGWSDGPALSADGRYVTFVSYASNLVNGDTNGEPDVFIHDQQAGTTTRVSVASDGAQGSGSNPEPTVIYYSRTALSADGRYVAFASYFSNLVSGDTNNIHDVFVHDQQTGITTRVSVASDGMQSNAWSASPTISSDGRYVAFESAASNLVSGDTNNIHDVFVHDRQTGITTRVSIASSGAQGDRQSGDPALSAEGRYVTFYSGATNLVSGDTNDKNDIFVHDRQTGATTRVSVASDGTQGNDFSGRATISAYGRYVAFVSSASNLVSNDTNNTSDIFVHERNRSFQVSYDGLSFVNFNYVSNMSQQSWEQFKKTFPGTQMETPNGQRRKGPERYFKSDDYQQIGATGNCAGFAAVSLIRYLGLAETVEPSLLSSANRAITITANLPEVVSGNVAVGQSDVKDYLHLYQARQMSYQYGLWWGQHWNDTPLQTYQAVKNRTQADEPVAVSIWQEGRGGHRVVAYRTEESGNTGSIYIYDSNWPNDATRKIDINLTTGQWTYTLWPGETWGGITNLHYSPATVNFPAELYPGDSGNAAIYGASSQDGTMVHVEGDADLLIANAQGQHIGYQNGNLVVTIPGAAPIREEAFNPANPTVDSFQTFFLPASSVYTATVQPIDATSAYTLTAFAAGSALSLDNISATAGHNDRLVLRNGVLDATFTPATDDIYCHYLTREVDGRNSRDYTTCVTDGAAVPVQIRLNSATNTLTFRQTGPQPLMVTLATSQVGDSPGQSEETVQVSPGTVVTTV